MKGGRVFWGWKRIPRKHGGDFRLGSTLAEKVSGKLVECSGSSCKRVLLINRGPFSKFGWWHWGTGKSMRKSAPSRLTLLKQRQKENEQDKRSPKQNLNECLVSASKRQHFLKDLLGKGKGSDQKGPHVSCGRSPQRQKPPMMVLGPFWFGGGVPSHSFSRNWTSQTSNLDDQTNPSSIR